jgi:type II secretory pathway pseudopilin PulG
MIVIVIMGILVSLSLPTYIGSREKAYDKEAITALRLIRSANRQYFSEIEYFYPFGTTVSNVNQINGNLSIDLPGDRWTYAVSGGGVFSATATRSPGAARNWLINMTTEPTCAGSCV